MDGTALVVADGKQGLRDHGAQNRLRQRKGVLLLHSGQFGKFLWIGAQDVELRQAAFDVDHVAAGGKYHHVVGHLSDNLAEQAGGENQGAFFLNLSRDRDLDAGFQVVAG